VTNPTLEARADTRALNGCVDAALSAQGRSLSIYDYARATGVSARMLIHYFGSKVELDRAVISLVQDRLRAEVYAAFRFSPDRPVERVVYELSRQDRAEVILLLRLLLVRALNGDADAIEGMRKERAMWRSMLSEALQTEEAAARAMISLEGTIIGMILGTL